LLSPITNDGCGIDMKNPDKSLSGKSDEIEVKICKNQELLPPS
jgi:hypothetical protein